VNDDLPGHLRMHPAKELIFSRLVEAKLEVVVGVQRSRSELALGAINGVGNVIVIDPDHKGARFNRYGCRNESEVVDLDFGSGIG